MIERRSAPEYESPTLVPLYKQGDPRWGEIDFDDPKWTEKFGTTIKSSGCGPTTLAMALSYYNAQEIFPPEIAQKVLDNGWRALDWDEKEKKLLPNGTHHDAMVEIPKLYEVDSWKASWEEAEEALSQGELVIQSQGPGHFTDFGHFILLTGIERDLYKVHDSGSRNITHATREEITRNLRQCWILEKPNI